MRSGEIAALLDTGDRTGASKALHSALAGLHGSGEAHELCALHRLAARYWRDDTEQAAFHHTHAYVYALEAGDEALTQELFARLHDAGRI